MAKVITATIPRLGLSKGVKSVQLETTGFVGVGCQAATEAFQKALGTVTEDTPTQEMYDTETGVERVQE